MDKLAIKTNLQNLAELEAKLWEHISGNFPTLKPESADIPYTYFEHDDNGNLIAGISANLYWDGIEILTLWIDPSLRGQSMGSKLLTQAETFAAEQGAVVSHLKTVDAVGFYEKNGYEVYGVLEDRPIGSLLHHMKKRL